MWRAEVSLHIQKPKLQERIKIQNSKYLTLCYRRHSLTKPTTLSNREGHNPSNKTYIFLFY